MHISVFYIKPKFEVIWFVSLSTGRAPESVARLVLLQLVL